MEALNFEVGACFALFPKIVRADLLQGNRVGPHDIQAKLGAGEDLGIGKFEGVTAMEGNGDHLVIEMHHRRGFHGMGTPYLNGIISPDEIVIADVNPWATDTSGVGVPGPYSGDIVVFRVVRVRAVYTYRFDGPHGDSFSFF